MNKYVEELKKLEKQILDITNNNNEIVVNPLLSGCICSLEKFKPRENSAEIITYTECNTDNFSKIPVGFLNDCKIFTSGYLAHTDLNVYNLNKEIIGKIENIDLELI